MTLHILLNIGYITNAYAVSIDCPNVINFGLGLGMSTQQPAIWTQLNVDCCTAIGVTCVGQRVTQIDWSYWNFNGVINGTAIPNGIQELYLYYNQLTGSIPSTWPSGLQGLSLDNNLLTGSTRSAWASGLQRLYLNDNQLTGSISSTWPSGLEQLYLNNNQLNGSIPSKLPSALQQLALHNNQFTGSIPNTWPIGLLVLAVSNNYLTGNVSSIPLTLQQLFLGYPGDTIKTNHFTGRLVLQQPQYLYINNNWITDVVVYDPIFLSASCDLSNNPLLGNPNIINLTMCIQTGLYNASSLPNTIIQSTTETSLLRNNFVSVFTQTSSNLKLIQW